MKILNSYSEFCSPEQVSRVFQWAGQVVVILASATWPRLSAATTQSMSNIMILLSNDCRPKRVLDVVGDNNGVAFMSGLLAVTCFCGVEFGVVVSEWCEVI